MRSERPKLPGDRAVSYSLLAVMIKRFLIHVDPETRLVYQGSEPVFCHFRIPGSQLSAHGRIALRAGKRDLLDERIRQTRSQMYTRGRPNGTAVVIGRNGHVMCF